MKYLYNDSMYTSLLHALYNVTYTIHRALIGQEIKTIFFNLSSMLLKKSWPYGYNFQTK